VKIRRAFDPSLRERDEALAYVVGRFDAGDDGLRHEVS
jgi:hypothetical protein